MSIYAFAEMENGKAKRIYASAKYPSKQIGNVFADCDFNVNLKYADELPLKIEGFYALVAFRPSHVLISRDVLGGKPLYFDNTTMTFSSFKHYFEEEPIPVLPGEVVKISYEGEVIDRKKYEFNDVFKPIDADIEKLKDRIVKSLINFRKNIKNACIAFSGGVDSSFLAGLYDLPLVTVTASKAEKEWVENSAKAIGRELEVYEFGEKEVREALPKVVSAIETTDKLQVSIALPIYLCVRFAKELGFSEVVFGQGADELFGGYKKYEELSGKELEQELINDVINIGEKNLVRDNKVAYSLEMKIITPYLQWEIIRCAISIPVELKVKKDNGVIRKYILREMAKEFIPKEIAYRDKKAIQYSTKTSNILKKILRDIDLNKISGEGNAKGFWA